jgi:hypothetical protein
MSGSTQKHAENRQAQELMQLDANNLTEKRCTKCKQIKALDQFYAQPRGHLKRAAQCKACDRTYYSKRWRDNKDALRPKLNAWKKNNPDKVQTIALRRYGLTSASYKAMLKAQGGLCGLCGKPFDNTRLGRPNIDHDHDTGVVRQLIHGSCNLVLGMAKEDVEVLRGAIDYL